MKILALADIHGNLPALERVLSANSDLGLILVAGDITNFGPPSQASEILAALSAHPGRPEICLVPGNCDPQPVREVLKRSGFDLDGKSREFGFCSVAGTGGGLKRAGLTSYERTEEELGTSLLGALKGAAASPVIVLTHNPPYGTNADRRSETHVGSHAFASIMAETGPALWVCGHIHESRCVSLEDGTLVVNPGSCASGAWALLEVRQGPEGWKLSGAALSTTFRSGCRGT